jgi:hypothetical protein
VQCRTLENYCHNKEATPSNGLKQGCPLYDTKPENVPPSLVGAIEAAESLRSYKANDCLPPITELTAWEYACFDIAENASRKIEAEAAKEATKQSASKQETPLGLAGQESSDSVFKDW